MTTRPGISLDTYFSQRIPYLTVIHLWDQSSDFLLASRHDHLTIGMGELGMGDEENISTIEMSSSTRSPIKIKAIQDTTGLETMMNSVLDFCKVNSSGGSKASMKDGDNMDNAILT